MNSKANERIARSCTHPVLLRVKDLATGEYADTWQCADCPWQMELAVLLEEAQA